MPASRAALAELTSLRPSGILAFLGLADSTDDVQPTWLIQAVRSVSALWPLVLLAKLCSAGFLADPSWFRPESATMLAIIAVIAIFADCL